MFVKAVRNKVLITSVFLGLFLMSACNSGTFLKDKFGRKEASAPPVVETLLFVLNAGLAQFEMQKDLPYQGQLILNKVNTSVAYFADRPNRDAGIQSLNAFLANWAPKRGELSNNPPNAGFIYRVVSSAQSSTKLFNEINLTLQNPLYNAALDQLVFDIELIEKGVVPPSGSVVEATLLVDLNS